MIDQSAPTQPFPFKAVTPQAVLRQTGNDRMAGSIPMWTSPDKDTAALALTQNFESVLKEQNSLKAPDLLGYRAPEATSLPAQPEESFGFGDLLDMVNPLQHIPVLNSLYREMTGDAIRPSSRIIGGALFGGPLGAAGSLINVVVEEETGKDITGNAIAYFTEGEAPTYKTAIAKSVTPDNPVKNLGTALAQDETKAYSDLPASLLAFADLGVAMPAKTIIEQPLHNQQSRYNA